MQKGLGQALGLCCVCLTIVNTADAFQPFKATVVTPEGPTTSLGPTLKGSYAHWMTPTSAFSFIGELGVRNYRAGLTLGWILSPLQQVKVSGEYLIQRMEYSFSAGPHTSTWVQQGALGGDYEYLLGNDYLHSLELDVYYSHAPSKSLSSYYGATTQNFLPWQFVNTRRIAGSDAGGVSPQLNINLWQGGYLGANLNWDDVVYHTKYTFEKQAIGFGGTLQFQQYMGEHARLFLLAAIRQPFNNYQGSLNWDNFQYHGRWNAGLFGEYTSGRYPLPSSYNIGINLNYFADKIVVQPDMKNEEHVSQAYNPYFLNWVSDPAVYMPQVLAIVDQKLGPACAEGGVRFYGAIAIQELGFIPQSFPTAQQFIGNDLQFSIQLPPLTHGDTITIDAGTGVVTVIPGPGFHDEYYLVTVTAFNNCGSATSRPFYIRVTNY